MLLHHFPRGSRSFAVLAALLAFAACGEDSPTDPNPNPTPQVGDLNVTVTTTGEDVDADGYTVSVAGTNRGTVAANGSLLIEDLAAGTYTVALGGLSQNCGIGATTSKSADVTAGQTASVTFDLTCVKNAGVLRIETVTDGLLLDPDGYGISVGGEAPVSVNTNGEAFIDVAPSVQHAVALSGQAANCTPHGEPSTTATAAFGDTATVRFDLTCFRDPIALVTRLASGFAHIFVVDASGGTAVDLTTLPGLDYSFMGPRPFNPDRTHLVFQSNNDNDGFAEYDIFVLALNKSEIFRHETEGPQQAGTWSPDGTQIAFHGFGPVPPTIYLAPPDLSSVQAIGDGLTPQFSPDGTRLAVAREPDIFVMNIDGSGAVNVSDPNGIRPADSGDWSPSWSPDGNDLLFRRDVFSTSFASDLYLAGAAGAADPDQLTNSSEPEEGGRIGPDGRIYFTQCMADCAAKEVWVMNLDGTGAMQLTNTGDELGGFNPSMTFEGPVAGGTQLLTAAGEFGARTVFRMGLDGTGRTEITSGAIENVGWD